MTAIPAVVTWLGGVVAIAGITLIGVAPWQTTTDHWRAWAAGVVLTVAGILLTCLGVYAHEKRTRR